MSTRGRRVKAIARSIELIDLVSNDEGHSHSYYRDKMGWTAGEMQTAVRYALEDKQLRQVGNRRSAKLYAPFGDVSEEEAEQKDTSLRIPLACKELCSYCHQAEVEQLVYNVDDDGNVDMSIKARYAVGLRQTFHLCRSCMNHRLPSSAEYHEDTAGYDEWQGLSQVGVQQVLRAKEWKILQIDDDYSDMGCTTSALCLIVEQLDEHGEETEHPDVYIRFTFPQMVDGSSPSGKVPNGQTSFARGYRYIQRMFSNPDALLGQRVTVSREWNRGKKGWFWSWTPFPRIPTQVIRSNRFMADVATTVANDIPPHDVSVPEHHIHTIMDDGEFTVIKIKKNLHTVSDTRYEHLRDAVVDFLQGECTIVDLGETLKETEGDE